MAQQATREWPRFRTIDPAKVFVGSPPRLFPIPKLLLCLKGGKPRLHGPTADSLIVLLGLSPASLYPRCDICASIPPAMRRHGIEPEAPVIAYGRYAAHEVCYQRHPDLETMKLPALDYHSLLLIGEVAPSPTTLLARMRAKLQMSGPGWQEEA